MNNESGVSFMNEYHSKSDLEYADNLKGWNEHLKYKKSIDVDGDGYIDIAREIDPNRVAKRRIPFNPTNISFDKSELENMTSDSVLSSPEDMLENRFNKFSRYGYLDPTHELVTGAREYLFFSKPDLHLVNVDNPYFMYDVLENVPFFNEAFNRYKLSYYSLQQYYNGKSYIQSNGLPIDLSNRYISLLSNMVTSSFDLSDINASDVTNNQNLYQINTSYREGSLSSDLQYDFSLEFKDTKYLDVYMLFKIYDEYFRYKYMLEIMPTRYDYIANKIYPEALSIWKIITDDTGRIMYWAKATGCTPMSVPRGTISNIEGNIKFTVNWKAQFIKDMDPVQLSEINYLTAKSMGINYNNFNKSIFNNTKYDDSGNPIFNSSNNCEILPISSNQTWAGYPLIINGEGPTVRTGHNCNLKRETIKNNIGFHRLVWINKK